MLENHSPPAQSGALRVLVGDDQLDVLEALRLLLKGEGYQTLTVDSPSALLRATQAEPFDLILMDLNYARDTTSGQEGLDLLMRLQALEDTPPIVVMTAWGNVELAVEAMRRGASDFVQKPWDNARLLETVRKQSKRREKSELELARHVQQKLFPRNLPRLDTADFAGQCLPARVVSGDYYDFLDLGGGIIGFVLADVSGKGMAAALLMSNLQALFRSQTGMALTSLSALLRSVNGLFYQSTPTEHYATLFFGQYDDHTRRLRYINCGHVSPLLLRAGRPTEQLMPTATVLGLFSGWDCEEKTIEIDSGDMLVAYSDGVTDAGIDTGQEFGEERLVALLESARNDAPQRCVERVIDAVQQYGAGNQTDDITVIAIRGR